MYTLLYVWDVWVFVCVLCGYMCNVSNEHSDEFRLYVFAKATHLPFSLALFYEIIAMFWAFVFWHSKSHSLFIIARNWLLLFFFSNKFYLSCYLIFVQIVSNACNNASTHPNTVLLVESKKKTPIYLNRTDHRTRE